MAIMLLPTLSLWGPYIMMKGGVGLPYGRITRLCAVRRDAGMQVSQDWDGMGRWEKGGE